MLSFKHRVDTYFLRLRFWWEDLRVSVSWWSVGCYSCLSLVILCLIAGISIASLVWIFGNILK